MTEPGPAEESPQFSGLRRLGKVFGTVVAPGTLLTALLYYFGRSHAFSYFEHFGVDDSVLGLSNSDYLLFSLDALYVPLTLSALAGLLALWARAVIREHVHASTRRGVVRALISVLAAAGILMTAAGIVSVFRPTVLTAGHPLLTPLSLTLGAPLVAYANGLRRPRGARRPSGTTAVAEWAIVFTLVAIGLFSAASHYSSAVGTTAARRFVQDLPILPAAVVYSERSLSLNAHGVTETRCRDAQAAYRFRYDGLALLRLVTDQYLLVPVAWNEAHAVAILLPRADATRLEFVPPMARLLTPRPGC